MLLATKRLAPTGDGAGKTSSGARGTIADSAPCQVMDPGRIRPGHRRSRTLGAGLVLGPRSGRCTQAGRAIVRAPPFGVPMAESLCAAPAASETARAPAQSRSTPHGPSRSHDRLRRPSTSHRPSGRSTSRSFVHEGVRYRGQVLSRPRLWRPESDLGIGVWHGRCAEFTRQERARAEQEREVPQRYKEKLPALGIAPDAIRRRPWIRPGLRGAECAAGRGCAGSPTGASTLGGTPTR